MSFKILFNLRMNKQGRYNILKHKFIKSEIQKNVNLSNFGHMQTIYVCIKSAQIS